VAHSPVSPFIFPIAAFHVSLLIGALTYVFRDGDPNGLGGLRTPRTLADKDAWREGNGQLGRIMPVISGVCMAVSAVAFFVPAMRLPITFFWVIGAQLAVLLLYLIKWW